MTSEQFAREIVALTDTLYRVSYSILREACDREDAVQSCLEKAWKKRKTLRRICCFWILKCRAEVGLQSGMNWKKRVQKA